MIKQPQGDSSKIILDEQDQHNETNITQNQQIEMNFTKQYQNDSQINESNYDYNMNTNFFQRLFHVELIKLVFHYSTLIKKKGKLDLQDLPQLRSQDNCNKLSDLLINNLNQLKLSMVTPTQMIIQLFKPVKLYIFSSFTSFTIEEISYITGSIFLNKLLDELNEGYSEIIQNIVIVTISLILYSLLGHMGCKYSYLSIQQIRIMTLITLYKKINNLSQYVIKEANIGKLVNLASNDFNNIEGNFSLLIILLTFPFSITYTFIILIFRFGWLGILSPILLILSCYFSFVISKQYEHSSTLQSQVCDERIKLCNEIIEGIRLIKMYAWEQAFQNFANIIRNKELGYLIKMNFWQYLSTSFDNTSTYIILAIQFIVIHFYSGDLTTGKIVSTIYLFKYIKDIIFLGGQGLFCFQQFKITAKRMLDIFNLNNSFMQSLDNEKQELNLNQQNMNQLEGEMDLIMQNFSAYWNQKQNQLNNPKEPVLKQLNLNIKRGTLTCVIGKIGSGKSSLLSSILQEIPTYSGTIKVNKNLAYVEQEPYTFNGSARDNILFGKQFVLKKYNEIIKLCCLEQDFKEFPDSDMTEIGERGINISGGQKARLSLARALYSEADVYLLDDPLSAVDSNVGRNIFNNVLKGYLKGKTIFLVTHQVPYAKDADQVIILDQGEIKQKGTFTQLESQLQEIIGQLKFEHHISNHKNEEDSNQTVSENQSEIEQKYNQDQQLRKEKGKLIKDEEDQQTNINYNTYLRYYASSQNILLWLITLLLFCTPEIIFVFYTKFLGQYQNDDENQNKLQSLYFALILAILYFCNSILKYIFMIMSHVRSVKNMHKSLVQSILSSKVLFFDQTPSGRILNAFSNDTGVIDNTILTCQCDFYEIFIGYIVLLVAAIQLNYWIVLVFIFQIVVLSSIINRIKYLLIFSRKMDLKYKTPIYTFFNTCIGGVLPIRIYQQQQQYLKRFIQLANNSQRVGQLFLYSSRGFAFSIHFIAQIFSFISIYITLAILDYKQNSDQIGNIILYVVIQTSTLQWGIRQKIQLEVGLSSAQRNFQLQDNPKEPAYYITKQDEILKNNNFPNKGEIVYKNIYFKYRDNLELVLKGINFKIGSKEKIGCVGRTGSGKSSLLQILFRMYEIENLNESGIFIDGFNIKDYGLHQIRQNISILPQTPFIFSGSIKRNLDPLQKYSDEQLWQVLDQVNLRPVVHNLQNKLETDMTQANTIFSVGQKQLICLCRAILKQSKILVLDEATSNIDMQTDELIQQKIKELFKECTVFTIAHRLNTIADYDKVLVIDSGKVVEFGEPYLLLVENIGDDLITKKDGLFALLVQQSGAKNSQHIFEIAKNKYLSSQNK